MTKLKLGGGGVNNPINSEDGENSWNLFTEETDERFVDLRNPVIISSLLVCWT